MSKNTTFKRPRPFGVTFLPQLLLGVLIIGITPNEISAGGIRETNERYESEMKVTVDHLIAAVESGSMSAAEAKMQLAELRNRFRKNFDEEHGIVEALIDAIEDGEMTALEAQERYARVRREMDSQQKRVTAPSRRDKSGGDDRGTTRRGGNDDDDDDDDD